MEDNFSEKVLPEWEFKRVLLVKLLEFNGGLADYYRLTELRKAGANARKYEVLKLAIELYLNLSARIKIKKYEKLYALIKKLMKNQDLNTKEIIELSEHYSELFLKEGITKFGIEKGDPGHSMV